METQIIDVRDRDSAGARQAFAWAGELLRAGGLVAFPTETVYGLGADALNSQAAEGIFAAKGRPADNPLIAHIDSLDMGERLAGFTPLGLRLAKKYWPGPLTLVLPKRPIVPDATTAGLNTVALRYPAHPAAQALIQAAGLPIAAPSANLSGKPSPTLAQHVYEDLAGKIPLILDGGPVLIGLESTVVDAQGDLPVLLRPGQISLEELAAFCGDCLLPAGEAARRPAAPGMKYRHYAPKGALYLAPDWRAIEAQRLALLVQGPEEPLLILSQESAGELQARGLRPENMLIYGSRGDQAAYARTAFACLREADRRGAGRIIAETVPQQGLGRAIMNRLSKAAAKK